MVDGLLRSALSALPVLCDLWSGGHNGISEEQASTYPATRKERMMPRPEATPRTPKLEFKGDVSS